MQLCQIEKCKKEQLLVKHVLFPFAFFPESYMVKLLLAGLLTYAGLFGLPIRFYLNSD